MSLNRKDCSEHHLKYEIDMLLFDAHSLCQLQSNKSEPQRVCTNAFLESYAIHLRNIMEFLWYSKNRSDDIRADDFNPTGCAKNSISRKSSIKTDKIAGFSFSDLRDKINKQISHLTSQRTEYKDEEKQWDIIKITCCISKYLTDYLDKCCMDEEYSKAIENNILSFKKEYCNRNESMQTQNYAIFSSTASVISIPFGNEDNES